MGNDKWHNYAALDRVSMLIDNVENALESGQHPALDTKKKRKLYNNAVGALAELYQKIGESDFTEQSPKEDWGVPKVVRTVPICAFCGNLQLIL